MTGPPRDWDKEMAEIDKLIAKDPGSGVRGPGSPATPVARGSAPPAQRASAPVARGGRTALTTWVRVGLGVTVAVGVGAAWPYAHSCGMALYGYVAAAGGVVLAGLWGSVTGWKRHIGLAHLVSLLVTLWGALLIGKVVADRSSYPRHPTTWSCPAVP